ncbi:hypothetical protein RH728_004452 [Vibrio vulnificus]|uniref:hypothetical protein n=1 Tax=Vibrio parahaemolyticus TaxID=670 RepID=UPI002827C857|nr:hypothetical protein [Vibrio parahaemolyticus]EKA6052551.1 hypothetical protein [Vibrio vulnificus]ELB7646238.1 hypothetical protein [Vibrio vulnificus]MDX8425255.1 hypothetical protein [Vibrio parahaemolyticus]
MENFIKANLIRSDLVEIDRQLSEGFRHDMSTMLLVKQAFLTITNLVDFELTIRLLYKKHPQLSEKYKDNAKNYDFSKYLRNKFVGHIKPELITKAIEWKPELRYSLNSVDDQKMMYVFNLFVLETAINSYVAQDGNHKVFESETDLVYPPDFERFLMYLETTIRSAIQFLDELCAALDETIEKPTPQEQKLEHWLKAGETTFEFIKK